MKRPLRKDELLLVILDRDISKDAKLKKNALVHVARWLPASKTLSPTSCGLSEVVRWQYPFLFWIAQNSIVCEDCLSFLIVDITKYGWDGGNVPFTPTYNMGVNSDA